MDKPMRSYIEKDGDLLTISPITNEFTAICEFDDKDGETMLCTESGYMCILDQDVSVFPDALKREMVQDGMGKYWYPITVRTMSDIIFKDGDKWVHAPIIESKVDATGYDKAIDMKNKKEFDTFKQASDYLNELYSAA